MTPQRLVERAHAARRCRPRRPAPSSRSGEAQRLARRRLERMARARPAGGVEPDAAVVERAPRTRAPAAAAAPRARGCRGPPRGRATPRGRPRARRAGRPPRGRGPSPRRGRARAAPPRIRRRTGRLRPFLVGHCRHSSGGAGRAQTRERGLPSGRRPSAAKRARKEGAREKPRAPRSWKAGAYLAPRTPSLAAFATTNFSRRRAGILIASPVCGLRPMRAL